jgi:multidrug resistance protein MdtO
MGGSLRTALAATLATLLLLILQAPSMAIGVFMIFIVSYETPYLTFKRGLVALALQCLGTGCALCLVAVTGNDPMARVIGVAAFAFIAAFVRSTSVSYIQAIDFAIFAIGTLYYFDSTTPAEQSVHLSLWQIAAGAVAISCKIAIEYIFTQRNPFQALQREIDERLRALENLLLAYASDRDAAEMQKQIAKVRRYAFMGQGKMQALFHEIDDRHKRNSTEDIEPTFVANLARLLDLAAAFAVHQYPTGFSGDRARMYRLAQAVAAIREHHWNQAKSLLNTSSLAPETELDRLEYSLWMLVALYTEEADVENVSQDRVTGQPRAAWFVQDTFTNMEHVTFALRVSLSAIVCYIIFNALAWPGISTAVTTVLVAGLSSSGATNQKMMFRFLGSTLGGVIFGLGCIIFLFPYVDTVTPFLIVVAAVTFIAAWVSRSPHFSYIGLQIAFSFYFVVFAGFSPPTQMLPATNRLIGILLALVVMVFVFKPEKSIDKMRQTLVHLIALQADYLEATAPSVSLEERRVKVADLRNRMEQTVATARGFAELMVYEFSSERKQHVQTSEKIELAISISGNLLLSVSSWPSDTGSESTPVEQLRASLERHLRSIAAALEQNGSFADTDVHAAATAEAPSYVRNSVEIYEKLRLQCCEIAVC